MENKERRCNMAAEVFRIEIPISVEDKTDPGVSQATRKINGFDKANQKTQERLNQMNRTKYQVVLDALDRASSVVGKVTSKARSIAGKTFSFTMKVIDMATAPLRGIWNFATSIQGAILGAVLGSRSLRFLWEGGPSSSALHHLTFCYCIKCIIARAKSKDVYCLFLLFLLVSTLSFWPHFGHWTIHPFSFRGSAWKLLEHGQCTITLFSFLVVIFLFMPAMAAMTNAINPPKSSKSRPARKIKRITTMIISSIVATSLPLLYVFVLYIDFTKYWLFLQFSLLLSASSCTRMEANINARTPGGFVITSSGGSPIRWNI
jgi:hypothetical protein